MSEYLEKLKDPRWQKVRLKVFERDGFKCLACGRETETLHVHHLVYTDGEPWDAPLENLETLCVDCHQFREEFNTLAGNRTHAPTKFIFAFERFCHLIYEKSIARAKKKNQKPMEIGKDFFIYWLYVSGQIPEEKPKSDSIAAPK